LIKEIDFGDPFHRSIFGGKTFTLGNLGDNQHYENLDPVNKYAVDEYGFRSKIVKSDILVGGCSFTFGLGVPEEAAWGKVVGKNLNKSVASVAIPGMSIPWIVEQIFIYFRIYGHPQKVLCLFPDLGRMIMLADGAVLVDGAPGVANNLPHGDGTHTLHTSNNYEKERPTYIKKPYNINHIGTYENSAYLSIRSIRTLEQYCSAAGIDFTWSTWDIPCSWTIEELNKNIDFSFSNYFNILDSGCRFYRKGDGINKQTVFTSLSDLNKCLDKHKDVECDCGLSCHSELIDLYGPENFYFGADTLMGEEFAHPGIHLQAHYAEAFLNQLKLKESN